MQVQNIFEFFRDDVLLFVTIALRFCVTDLFFLAILAKFMWF